MCNLYKFLTGAQMKGTFCRVISGDNNVRWNYILMTFSSRARITCFIKIVTSWLNNAKHIEMKFFIALISFCESPAIREHFSPRVRKCAVCVFRRVLAANNEARTSGRVTVGSRSRICKLGRLARLLIGTLKIARDLPRKIAIPDITPCMHPRTRHFLL